MVGDQPAEAGTSHEPSNGSSQSAPTPPSPYAAAAEAVAKRTELAAKSLGGLGTTVVTAVGIAKFSDVWPYPPGSWLAVVGVVGGFVLMAAAVAAFSYRLWGVNQPIIWRTDPARVIKLRRGELNLVLPLYDEMAHLNEVESLRAYEARALRLERVSGRVPPRMKDSVAKQAATIRAEISATHARANLRVVLHRANRAIRGAGAIFAYALFLVGVLGFGLGADYLQSQRSDAIALAKSCSEAGTAGGGPILPPICHGVSPAPTSSPNPQEEVASAVEGLGSALVACESAVQASAASEHACDPIRSAMSDMLDTP